MFGLKRKLRRLIEEDTRYATIKDLDSAIIKVDEKLFELSLQKGNLSQTVKEEINSSMKELGKDFLAPDEVIGLTNKYLKKYSTLLDEQIGTLREQKGELKAYREIIKYCL